MNKKDKTCLGFTKKGHDKKVRKLETEIKKINIFNEVTHPYPIEQIIREVDLLTMGKESGWYEIKYKHSHRRIDHATERFEKFKKAFPDFIGRGYYVSCDGFAIKITNTNGNRKENIINYIADKL